MHVFQPYPIHEIEFNPFTIGGHKGAALTTEVDGRVNTTALSNVGFGKFWEKDACFAFLREERYTKELLDKSEFFSLTFFDDKYVDKLEYLRSVSGHGEDKLSTVGVEINKKIDIPYLDDGNFVCLCAKLARIDMSESDFIPDYYKKRYYSEESLHSLFVGEILELIAR